MKLNALAGAVPGEVKITGNPETEIASLCVDSRRATPGSLFFCIPGLHTDATIWRRRRLPRARLRWWWSGNCRLTAHR